MRLNKNQGWLIKMAFAPHMTEAEATEWYNGLSPQGKGRYNKVLSEVTARESFQLALINTLTVEWLTEGLKLWKKNSSDSFILRLLTVIRPRFTEADWRHNRTLHTAFLKHKNEKAQCLRIIDDNIRTLQQKIKFSTGARTQSTAEQRSKIVNHIKALEQLNKDAITAIVSKVAHIYRVSPRTVWRAWSSAKSHS